jgi:hypothetical protein
MSAVNLARRDFSKVGLGASAANVGLWSAAFPGLLSGLSV